MIEDRARRASRIKRAIQSSYVRSITVRITGAALAFLASIILARLLGPEQYGKYGILLATATVLAIPFSTGLSRAITKEIAEAKTSGDMGRISQIITLGTKTFLALLLPLIAVSSALYFFGVTVAGTSLGVVIAAVLAPLFAADANRQGAMQGLGSAIRSQIPNQVVRPLALIGIVTVMLLVSGNADAVSGATAYSAAALFSLMLGGIMLRQLLNRTITGEPARTTVRWSHFIPLVATMSLLGGSKVLSSSIDLIILNALGDLTGAGHYKVALAGIAVAAMGMTAIQTVLYTRIAATIPSGNVSRTVAQIDSAVGWQAASTLLTTLLIYFAGRPVITLLYGADYLESWTIVLVLCIGYVVSSLLGPSEEILMLTGKQLVAAFVVLGGIAIVVFLASVLGPIYGALGVAIASTTGMALRSLTLMVLAHHSLGANPSIFGAMARMYQKRRTS